MMGPSRCKDFPMDIMRLMMPALQRPSLPPSPTPHPAGTNLRLTLRDLRVRYLPGLHGSFSASLWIHSAAPLPALPGCPLTITQLA
ncbi:hypothetical protein FKM82_004928 [Ascaphus truei]